MQAALTKMDIAALRQCDSLSVGLGVRDGAEPFCEAVRSIPKTESNPFATDARYSIPALVTTESGSLSSYTSSKPTRCFETLSTYRVLGPNDVGTALATLREGDHVEFRFCPDYAANDYVAKAGLHADCLRMFVLRKGKRVGEFTLATSICPDNSARMCKGGAPSRRWHALASGAMEPGGTLPALDEATV